MAVTLKNAGQCKAITRDSALTGSKVTLSWCLRVNSKTASVQKLLGFGSLGVQATYDSAGMSVQAYANFGGTSSPLTGKHSGMQMAVPYHFIVVYDKDDPARQFFAINGFKQAWDPQTGAMRGPARLDLGSSSPVDVTIQDVVVIDGYAATDLDVETLSADPEAAAGFAAAAAAVPGAKVAYYTLAGPAGAAAADGDAGISGGSDPAYALAVTTPTPADTVTYAPAMIYDAQCEVLQAYVGSSGRTVTIVVGSARDNLYRTPAVAALNARPMIRIDGGAPIELSDAAEDGSYIDVSADGAFFTLPAGVVVTPGQRVVMDAPKDWFPVSFGRCSAAVGVPVANYAGMAVSKGLWPNRKPARVGTNEIRTASAGSATFTPKNLALLFGQSGQPQWPDGTVKGDNSPMLVLFSGAGCPFDGVGTSAAAGRWVARWDDYYPDNPVNIAPVSSGSYKWVELPEYANAGDAQGRGKVRVWDLQIGNPWPFTLAAAVASDATSIPFVETADWGFSTGTMLYLTLDDEQVLIGGYDKTAKAFVGCTRGWNRTTAAAHAVGTAGVAKYATRNATLQVRIGSPDKSRTRYANMGIYAPGSIAIPAEPGPLAVPPPDNMALDPTLESYVKDGVGAWRYMTESPVVGGNTDIDWPEQLSRPDQPHFAKPRVVERFVITSVKPFDVSSSPYCYSATPWPGAETYGAVLGAAIETAPAPGTVESVTITDGRLAPILLGQPLFAGDEVMEVKGLPAAGSDVYQVARGAVGTTPAPHAAGAITVGYRVAVGNMDGFVPIAGKPMYYYEAVFDEAASSPLAFGRDLSEGLTATGVVPNNLTVRRTFTLAAPLGSTATDVYLTAADPADWNVVAQGVVLTVDGEALTAVAVDASVGKVTVAARPAATAASHALGAAVATSSSRVLMQTADGTRRVYNKLADGYSRMLPLGPWRALITVVSEAVVPAGQPTPAAAPAFQQDFAGAAGAAITYPRPGRSYEFMAHQTGVSPGAWHWLNLPFRATDATVYEIAKAVRDNLPPGRRVVVELSNEDWNWIAGYWATRTNYVLARLLGGVNPMDMHVLRSAAAFAVVKKCFAEVGRADEVDHVICWQAGIDILSVCRRLGVEPDAWGVSPYYEPPNNARFGAVFNAIDDDCACDLTTFIHLRSRYGSAVQTVGAGMRHLLDVHEGLTGKRPKTYLYEGGLQAIVATNTPGNPDPERRRSRDIVHNPLYYFTELTHYAAIQDSFAVDLFMQFCWSQALAKGGPDTHYWTMLLGPMQRAGRGDGRNGGVNNKDYTYAGAMDQVKGGGDAWRESVRLQAWLDWQADWRAANAPVSGPTDPNDPPPDPDPGQGPIIPPIHGKPLRLPMIRPSRRGFKYR